MLTLRTRPVSLGPSESRFVPIGLALRLLDAELVPGFRRVGIPMRTMTVNPDIAGSNGRFYGAGGVTTESTGKDPAAKAVELPGCRMETVLDVHVGRVDIAGVKRRVFVSVVVVGKGVFSSCVPDAA